MYRESSAGMTGAGLERMCDCVCLGRAEKKECGQAYGRAAQVYVNRSIKGNRILTPGS